jgi:hypothetical protein
MGFRISYLSNYHNSFETHYNGTYIGNSWNSENPGTFYHTCSSTWDIYGNVIFHDYEGMHRVRIFQHDGKNNKK